MLAHRDAASRPAARAHRARRERLARRTGRLAESRRGARLPLSPLRGSDARRGHRRVRDHPLRRGAHDHAPAHRSRRGALRGGARRRVAAASADRRALGLVEPDRRAPRVHRVQLPARARARGGGRDALDAHAPRPVHPRRGAQSPRARAGRRAAPSAQAGQRARRPRHRRAHGHPLAPWLLRPRSRDRRRAQLQQRAGRPSYASWWRGAWGTTIPLADMARLVGLGVHHFCRVFRQTFGESPHGYLRARRLERGVRAGGVEPPRRSARSPCSPASPIRAT